MENKNLEALLRHPSSVFSFGEAALIWRESNRQRVQKRLYRYVRAGKLYSVRKGFYAKDPEYDRYELATKIYPPSYIGFETVLAQEGVIFQYSSSIFVASYLTRAITADGQSFVYRKIKDGVLTNTLGIEKGEHYFRATKERAFVDLLYVRKAASFDHLSSMDFEKCFAIAAIFDNKALMKRVEFFSHLAKDA
jgi:hypothetical protein